MGKKPSQKFVRLIVREPFQIMTFNPKPGREGALLEGLRTVLAYNSDVSYDIEVVDQKDINALIDEIITLEDLRDRKVSPNNDDDLPPIVA